MITSPLALPGVPAAMLLFVSVTLVSAPEVLAYWDQDKMDTMYIADMLKLLYQKEKCGIFI